MGARPESDADRHSVASTRVLLSRRSSVVLVLLTIGSYAGTVTVTTGCPVLMAVRPLDGPFSLAMILGALQMLLILLATGVYIRAANRREATRESS